MDDSSKLILFTIIAKFIKPKTAAFEDVYISPVSSEASVGRILNTNQLHNIERLMNLNRQLFLLRKKLHFLICDGQQEKFSINAFLKYMYYKNFREQEIFAKLR